MKHNKIVLLAKSKLNSLGVLISKLLIDSNISHNEFILIKDMVKTDEKCKDLYILSNILVYL